MGNAYLDMKSSNEYSKLNEASDVIRKGDIEAVIADVEIDKNVMGQISENEKVLSPGMKYRHYAPKTKCILVYGEDSERVIEKIKEISTSHNKVLILALNEDAEKLKMLGYEVNISLSVARDIVAGCGQMTGKYNTIK